MGRRHCASFALHEQRLELSAILWGQVPGWRPQQDGRTAAREPPFDYERPQVKFPDYWGNDAWSSVQPHRATHAMPGWTLAVGGVYTEFVKSAEEIGSTGEDQSLQDMGGEKNIRVARRDTPRDAGCGNGGRPFMTGAFYHSSDDPIVQSSAIPSVMRANVCPGAGGTSDTRHRCLAGHRWESLLLRRTSTRSMRRMAPAMNWCPIRMIDSMA